MIQSNDSKSDERLRKTNVSKDIEESEPYGMCLYRTYSLFMKRNKIPFRNTKLMVLRHFCNSDTVVKLVRSPTVPPKSVNQ